MRKLFTLLMVALCATNVMAAGDGNIVKYDFEHFKVIDEKFHSWFELNEDGSEAEIWASGNLPFAIMNQGGPETYPTASEADGYDGACVKLETKSTGPLGAMFGMPIAAGNLFMGEMDAENSIMDPLGSTKFGIRFNHKPLKFTGYYKYKAGEKVTDKSGAEITDKIDQGRIYSVLYRNADAEGNPVVLNGNDVLTSPQIVAIADLGEIKDVEDWTRFEVAYDYGENEIDADLLSNGGYNLTVVFTSSVEGASFVGAAGSTLYVDKVAIECEAADSKKVFTDNLQVTLSGVPFDPQETSIIVEEQADGKYTLELNNFILGPEMAVGNIQIKDVNVSSENGKTILTSTQNIMITEGDAEGVDTWIGPGLGEVPVSLNAEMTDDKLYAEININFMGMEIAVVFGTKPTGIQDAFTVGSEETQEIYTIDGTKVSNMQSGKVYILRKANGKTVKIIKK